MNIDVRPTWECPRCRGSGNDASIRCSRCAGTGEVESCLCVECERVFAARYSKYDTLCLECEQKEAKA